MTKYVAGAFGSLLGALGGAWLILAPFALAYQPSGADWINATFVDFWTGLPLLVVSLVGLAAYAAGLVAELKARGVIEEQPQSTPQAGGAGATGARQGDSGQQLLVPLVAAMLKDMQDRERERTGGARGDTNGDTIEGDARGALPGAAERSVRS